MPPYNIPDASSMKEGGPAPILYEKREVVADDNDLPVGRLLERPVSELRQDLSGMQYLRDYLSTLPIPTCDEEGCSMDCDENTYVEDDILEEHEDPLTSREIQSILLDYRRKGNIDVTHGGLGSYPNDNNPLYHHYCKEHNEREDSDDD